MLDNTHNSQLNTGLNSALNTDVSTNQNKKRSHIKPYPYIDGKDYLRDYFSLLTLKLYREVALLRAVRGDDRQEAFLGLFISDDDINHILTELNQFNEAKPYNKQPYNKQPDNNPPNQKTDELGSNTQTITTKINNRKKHIDFRLGCTEAILPHQQLADALDMDQPEIELLLLCLAPEIDSRFGKAYGFLHDDVSRKNLSLELANKLMDTGDNFGIQLRQILREDGPLRRFNLIHFIEGNNTALGQRALKIDDHIVNYLLDSFQLDSTIVSYLDTPFAFNFEFQTDTLTQSAHYYAQRWQNTPKTLIIKMQSQFDVHTWMAIFCSYIQTRIFVIRWQRIKRLELTKAKALLTNIVRDTLLTHSIVHLVDIDADNPELIDHLVNLNVASLCLSTRIANPQEYFGAHTYEVSATHLSSENRLSCWKSSVAEDIELPQEALAQLAERYRLDAKTIHHVCTTIDTHSLNEPYLKAVKRRCQTLLGGKMQDVAQRISTKFTFNDLVLPTNTMAAIKELVIRQENSQQVLVNWGLADLFHQSHGCTSLFVGPSGTGKTMAASILANELGLDAYRIDLSGVVSKYIGETEKNLERIFNMAEESEVVLFIDEADALFGKRSEVKDAHDRYANIEVSYLLQKMEAYDGLVILASNFGQNIDDAFFRRFSTVIEFPLPGITEREKLWQKLYLSNTPVSDDIDLDLLASQFELSGGHIKNCILNAAYYAAATASAIDMQTLIYAIAQEYTKIGKPISKSNFGDHYVTLKRMNPLKRTPEGV